MQPDEPSPAERLAKLIEAHGPVSLAHYMTEANRAYYRSGDPLGRDGDFITAPEVSQMFGELIGLWLADLWLRADRPERCHYVELGPGRGTLARDAGRAMRKFGLKPEFHFVEISDKLREKQREAVPGAVFHDKIASLPGEGALLIVANEFFDALAIRQYQAASGGWRERVVEREGSDCFVAVPGSLGADALIPPELQASAPGTIVELSPDRSEAALGIAGRIAEQGGALLVIDYGYEGPAAGNTLQAVRGHRPADPFTAPGSADLTAHVDFAELANAARGRGLKTFGPAEQGEWLRALGIELRADALAEAAPERRNELISALARLTGEEAMGQLFKVLAAMAPGWPDPEGFGDKT